MDGTTEDAALPRLFDPDQPVLPFAEMAGMGHEVVPGVWADLALEGDIFEMEDQRNWTDASFKTFSTPLRIPYPVGDRQGTRIQPGGDALAAPEQPAWQRRRPRPPAR